LILWDHDDVKWYWIEKCCNKFKKPTSTLGDPKRGMILRCQWIQQQIHFKSASVIMGMNSEGDDGLSLSEDDDEEEDVEQVEVLLHGGNSAVDASVVGNCTHTNTPTVLVDGGVGIVVVEEVGIPTIPPLITQQLAEVCYASNAPQLTQTQQQLV
jgi:hypothetical protein